ncbi:MAG: neutral zinc metallopeptidase, partial [Burkholderiaceae bacterium]
QVFSRAGQQYRPPKLVLYRGRTNTACGLGSAAAGPFYCPADERVYIDLDFFQTMRDKLRAPGEFAQAYVIAHEVGHHVQNLLGTMQQMQDARRRVSEQQYNALSVRLELQADCYAGVWAHHSQQARGWLERGDLEQALAAAAAVGDDNLQRQSQGVVVPESFTHGSSAQRMRWFRIGFQNGQPGECDTFSARSL